VAGCCECGDEPSGYGATELLSYDIISCNLAETNCFVPGVVVSCLVSERLKPLPLGLEPRTGFWASGLCLCNLAKTNKIVLAPFFPFAYFPSCRNRPRTQESSSTCGLCSSNRLFETNNSDLDAVRLSVLVSEPQVPPSSEVELRLIFRVFDTPLFSLVSWNKEDKFGADRFIPSRVISNI
jgi:hypothetical protein